MLKRIIIVLVLLVLALFLYGVAKSIRMPAQKLPPGSIPVGSVEDILDTKWVWNESILPDGAEVIPKKTGAFHLVMASDGTVSGATDCNSFSGSYKLGSDGILSFGALASTKMFCEGSQEVVFTTALSKITHYTFMGDVLVLVMGEGAGSMYFEKAMIPIEVTLRVGETEVVNDFLSLTLNSLVQDSRCPVDVTCIQAGAVTVNATIKNPAKSETRNFSSDEVTHLFDEYSISISDVTSPRKANQEIDPEDYEITFRVE